MSRIQPPLSSRPRILLAYSDSAFASCCARVLRRLGWEVHMATRAGNLERLVALYQPRVLVLEAAASDPSAREVGAQLALTFPANKVLLIADEGSVGGLENAADTRSYEVVARAGGVPALVEAIYREDLARAV